MSEPNFSDAMCAKKAAPFLHAEVDVNRLGTVLLVDPLSRRVLTCFFVVLMLGIVFCFVAVETTRKVHCVGRVVSSAGVIAVASMQAGIVIEKRVEEGQLVVKGQPLFVVSGERTSRTIGAAIEATSRLLQTRADGLNDEMKLLDRQGAEKESALRQRTDHLMEEVARLDDQLTWQQQRVNLSQAGLLRLGELAAGRFVSAAQLQVRKSELLDQCQRLSELRRAKMALAKEVSAIAADIRYLQIQVERDRNSLQRNVDSLHQEMADNEARREWLVLAERDGIVTAISAEPGQNVQAAQVMAWVVPQGAPLEAEILAPSHSIGLVRQGTQVWLRFHTYPFQKFGQFRATVKAISEAALDASQGGGPASGHAEPHYRIRLSLEQQSVSVMGQHLPLKPGMQFDATIVQERRKLYEWMAIPLFGAPETSSSDV